MGKNSNYMLKRDFRNDEEKFSVLEFRLRPFLFGIIARKNLGYRIYW